MAFNNGGYLKGGYFQIIARAKSVLLKGGIQDVAGNALDGEYYGPTSASGNGVPGGDFVANVTAIHNGNSGPITIIGVPHPNDPAGHFTRKSSTSHTKKTVTVKSSLANRHVAAPKTSTKLKVAAPIKASVTVPHKAKLAATAVAKKK